MSITPATSEPDTCGKDRGLGIPRVSQRSMWLRADARTSMRTSPGPGTGVGTSAQRYSPGDSSRTHPRMDHHGTDLFAARERVGPLPSIDVADALLDER